MKMSRNVVINIVIVLGVVLVLFTALNSKNLVKIHYKDFSFETTEKSTPTK
ncbi:hypothetical protein [Clostridium sp. C2-6-12]|uniref:hypothetical protein n=1 Tax=Clostridium sp. C2-6-12 TaxID=2698832 RepID=UPI00136DD5E6|nr:hypothetical protein [Clostridium sp. C2-6-12]